MGDGANQINNVVRFSMLKSANVSKVFYVFLLFAVGVLSVFALNSRDNGNNKFSEFHQSDAVALAQQQQPYRASETQSANSHNWYTVLRVIDGDTIEAEQGDSIITTRLIGIDSPEVVDPRKTVQCFGIEASEKAKELLNGKKVRLEKDLSQDDRDKYGRALRYVFLQDGTFFNKLMIREGYAREYTYKSNPYIYQTEFLEAQREAREQKRGLWEDGVCVHNWKLKQ